jgi:hypothetical protein
VAEATGVSRSDARGTRHDAARVGAVLLGLGLLLAGCPSAGPATPSDEKPLQAPRFLAVSREGAVIFYPDQGLVQGVDRAGVVRWSDSEMAQRDLTIVCLRACPDALASAGIGEPGYPMRRDAAGATAVAVSSQPHARVLAADSTADAVVEEGDGQRFWIRITGPAGTATIPVAAGGYQWTATADGLTALAFNDRVRDGTGTLLWFARGASGWQLTRQQPTNGWVSHACPTGEPATALLAGQAPSLVSGDERLAAGEHGSSECVAGRHAMALINRSTSGRAFRTRVQALSPTGRPLWTRNVAAEASVSAHPRLPLVGIGDGRTLDLVDANATTVWSRPGIRAATFSPDGELIAVTDSGTVQWLPVDTQHSP